MVSDTHVQQRCRLRRTWGVRPLGMIGCLWFWRWSGRTIRTPGTNLPKLISGVYMLFGNDGCVFGVVPHNDSQEIGDAQGVRRWIFIVSQPPYGIFMKEPFACPVWSKIGGYPSWPSHWFHSRILWNRRKWRNSSCQALDFCSGLFDMDPKVISLRYDVLLGLQKHWDGLPRGWGDGRPLHDPILTVFMRWKDLVIIHWVDFGEIGKAQETTGELRFFFDNS